MRRWSVAEVQSYAMRHALNGESGCAPFWLLSAALYDIPFPNRYGLPQGIEAIRTCSLVHDDIHPAWMMMIYGASTDDPQKWDEAPLSLQVTLCNPWGLNWC